MPDFLPRSGAKRKSTEKGYSVKDMNVTDKIDVPDVNLMELTDLARPSFARRDEVSKLRRKLAEEEPVNHAEVFGVTERESVTEKTRKLYKHLFGVFMAFAASLGQT